MRAGYIRKRTVLPTLQYSTAVRDAQMRALAAAIGPHPLLQLWTGGMPVACAMADAGRLLCEVVLPEQWATVAEGALRGAGTWQAACIGQGTAGHWRMKSAATGVTHAQGTVGGLGSGATAEIDDPYLEPELIVLFEGGLFVLTAGNE